MKPWEKEENYHKVDFEGYSGYILRQPDLLILNGYVVLEKDHPLYGCGMYDNKLSGITVHGGITYSSNTLGFKASVGGKPYVIVGSEELKWVLGFDTGHYYDFIPGFGMGPFREQEYRTKNYVEDEIKKLIMQLKEIKHVGTAAK